MRAEEHRIRASLSLNGSPTVAPPRDVHPHALMGFHVLHVAADCPMLPMLVETGTPTIAQPAHDAFGIARPAVVFGMNRRQVHGRARVLDFDDSYLLAHTVKSYHEK